ncbi:toprim domain-containing protein [Candidatus Bathyarchaeota archaeon]|nr:MAG: toprim domain-containing protein [Candidatus Bathyarchaeota archaeon]
MLSTSLKRRVEKVLQLLDRLARESAKGTPIIVEGRKDVNTLRDLAIKGDIISAKTSGRSLLDVLGEVEKRSKHEVILLMDFDRRGKEGTKHLTQHFEKMRIKPNLFFWRGLLSLVGRDVRDIEGLATYLENLKKKCGNRI